MATQARQPCHFTSITNSLGRWKIHAGDEGVLFPRAACHVFYDPVFQRTSQASISHQVICGYARMLIARAITSVAMTRDTAASVTISSLAHGLIAEMSVGLKAVAVQKPRDK